MNIQVYVPNLPNRKDRKASIINQFADKPQFFLSVLKPKEDKNGYVSLWKTFFNAVVEENKRNSKYFIFCEDDHVFTDDYNFEMLLSLVDTAQKLSADLLLGGVSWIDEPLQVGDNLFWLNKFNGMQFSIVFNSFYKKILSTEPTGWNHVTDIYLSELSSSIFVAFPFLSIQKEFGYSDVTENNNILGHVESLFLKTYNRLFLLDKVRKYYDNIL